MKKIFMIIACVLALNSLAQSQWVTRIPTRCFCCVADTYRLPTTPPIDGPRTISCNPATYTTTKCQGASFIWNVSPAVSFSGQGTNTIKLNPPFNAAQHRISVTIKCGNRTVSRTILVNAPIAACKPDFRIVLEEMSNGKYRVRTTAQSTGAGYRHLWYLYEKGSCPNGTSTVFKHSQISSTGSLTRSDLSITAPGRYGFQYTGLVRGKCYMLVHYVYCCGQWKRQTKCFCIPSSAPRLLNEQQLRPAIITDSLQEDRLPEEVKRTRDGNDNN